MTYLSPADMAGSKYWVPGDGPKPAALAFVGEAPSSEEVRQGLAFVGPAGQINWQLAGRYAGLVRGGNYVTNWCKVPLSGDDKKKLTEEEIAGWTELLELELAEVKPKTVIALGAWAVKALLGPEYSLYWCNGIPIDRGDFAVLPVVHPAAGIHEPDLLQETVTGYKGVKSWLQSNPLARQRGAWNAAEPEVFEDFIIADVHPEEVSIDTEGSLAEPNCLTFTTKADYEIQGYGPPRAFIIYAHDRLRLEAFTHWLYSTGPRLILQNSLHDAPILEAMCGLNIWDFEVRDTMIESYDLQDLPRDLKNLARRILDLPMTDYEDVVRPWWEKAVADWKNRLALSLTGLTFEPVLTPKGKPRMSKGQPVTKRVGPAIQLKCAQRIERDQQFKPHELAWAETQAGPFPTMALRHVPKEEAKKYAGKDPVATYGVYLHTHARIKDEGLEAVSDLDHAVLPLVDDMQRCGLHIDLERYWKYTGEISEKKVQVREDIRQLLALDGYPGADEFNPGSGDQVAEFCRWTWKKEGKLGLTRMTKGGTRESTDDKALSGVAHEHPFIPLELEYKELDKYEGTYLLPLQPLIHQSERGGYRAHVRLNPATVVSGRFSSGGKNLDGTKGFNALAVPSRTELGLRLRSIFTAPPGMKLVSWDLSQIELRIAAGLSKDPVMLEAFTSGKDLHSLLAAKLFGEPYELTNSPAGKWMRTPSKNINYAWVYGVGWQRLYEELRSMGVHQFDQGACKRLLYDTRRVYAACDRWLAAAAQEARRTGEVRDSLGRRRFLPACQLIGDRWPLLGMRLEGERQAGNFKVQPEASEMLKTAMVGVWREVYPELKRRKRHLRFWLQIHDELMGEIEEGAFEEVDALIRPHLKKREWLIEPVKIESEGKLGNDWGELK